MRSVWQAHVPLYNRFTESEFLMNLVKGQAESLVNNGTPVTKLYVGVGWDLSGGGDKGLKGWAKRKKGVDLDLAAVAYDQDRNPIRIAWFDALDPFHNGAILMSGDNKTGKGDGDDESVVTDFTRLPAQVQTVVYIVSAFKQDVSFANVEGVTCRLVDQSQGNQEIGMFFPPIDSRQSAIVMAKVTRTGSGWNLTVVNEMGSGRSRDQLLNLGRTHA